MLKDITVEKANLLKTKTRFSFFPFRKQLKGVAIETQREPGLENEFIAPNYTKLHVVSQNIKTAEGSIVNGN